MKINREIGKARIERKYSGPLKGPIVDTAATMDVISKHHKKHAANIQKAHIHIDELTGASMAEQVGDLQVGGIKLQRAAIMPNAEESRKRVSTCRQ